MVGDTRPRNGQRQLAATTTADSNVVIKLLCVGGFCGKSTFSHYWETGHYKNISSKTTGVACEKTMHVPIPNLQTLPPATTEERPRSPVQSACTPPGTQSQSSAMDVEMQPIRSNHIAIAAPIDIGLTAADTPPSDELDPVIRRDFRIIAPTPIDFGPAAETMPAHVHLWDFSSAGRCGAMTRFYYLGALGALVFCNVRDPERSLDDAIKWKADIDSKLSVSTGSGPEKVDKKVPCWLVVNWCDLLVQNDQPAPLCMSAGHLDQFVKEHGFVGWSYTSPKKGVHVEETVAALLSHVVAAFPHEIWKKVTNKTAQQTAKVVRLNERRGDSETRRASCGSS